MDWVESVREIRKANENNRLVVFVGAGVSKNSGIPTWGELIQDIAKKIGYSHCNVCKEKKPCSKEADCKERFSFTQDEYLRIPEYYFIQDHSEKHKAYYQLLQDSLGSGGSANAIDEEIFSLLPNHIVTTNYDNLLEESMSVNVQLYTVVSQDSELLSKASDHYILKMHGDLSKPETMVLKESDYINYEQEHPLISTFLRSLLINHTFLFLGYGLNDNNLNLIIGWINYFRKTNSVTERPKSFLVNSDYRSDFERFRLSERDIEIIDPSIIPESVIEDSNASSYFSSPIPKALYAYLRCINDPKLFEKYIPIEKIVQEKYEVFQPYRKIAKEDLLSQFKLDHTELLGDTLIFWKREWFESIRSLIEKKEPVVISSFQRANFSRIELADSMTKECCEVPSTSLIDNGCEQLYINNDYITLAQEIEKSDDIALKIFWGVFLRKPKKELMGLIDLEAHALKKSHYITIMLHKMRARLALLTTFDRQIERTEELRTLFRLTPARYENAVGFLKMIFQSDAANINKMEEELEKHEKRYNSGGSSFFTGHAHFHIMKIQAYAYEYYRFFMRNYLPIHYFQNPENYFSPYLRSILCSYTPVPVLSSKDLFVKTHRASFPLNEIDFDMFVKFTKPKTLKAWFKEYHVKNIELDSSINVAQKFENLCKSLKIAQDSTWFTQLHCFCVMCRYLNLSDNEQERVFSALVTALCDFRKTNMAALGELLEPLLYLLRFCLQDKCENEKRKLLEELLQPEVQESLQNICGQAMLDILDLLPYSIPDDKKEWLQQQIELSDNGTMQFQRAFAWRNFVTPTFFHKIVEKNTAKLTPPQILCLLHEKRIEFSEDFFAQLLKTLEEEHIKRQQSPGVRSFPDQLLEAINCCIIIKLNGHDIDIKKLEPYVQYSDQLRFMLDPQTFDYKLVDTRDSMWQNLIFSDLYKPFFIQHKKELLSEQLEEIWRNGLETPWQQRIVYGILLDKDELIQFGRP